MSLIETIEHVKDVIGKNDFPCEECKKEHEELLGFLLELNRYRNNQSVDAVPVSDAVQCRLAQENDKLKQKVAALCQERDALQRRCDDLEKSRQAWAMKAMALGRHGHWIEDGDVQVCSECGAEHGWDEYRASFCEDCGAQMDEVLGLG